MFVSDTRPTLSVLLDNMLPRENVCTSGSRCLKRTIDDSRWSIHWRNTSPCFSFSVSKVATRVHANTSVVQTFTYQVDTLRGSSWGSNRAIAILQQLAPAGNSWSLRLRRRMSLLETLARCNMGIFFIGKTFCSSTFRANKISMFMWDCSWCMRHGKRRKLNSFAGLVLSWRCSSGHLENRARWCLWNCTQSDTHPISKSHNKFRSLLHTFAKLSENKSCLGMYILCNTVCENNLDRLRTIRGPLDTSESALCISFILFRSEWSTRSTQIFYRNLN